MKTDVAFSLGVFEAPCIRAKEYQRDIYVNGKGETDRWRDTRDETQDIFDK